jgi:hypothetical protein
MEVGGSGGSAAGTSLGAMSAELGLRYRAAEYLLVDASFGFTYASTNVAGELTLGGMPISYAASIQRVEPGNPTFGATFVHRSDSLLLEVGLALSVPSSARAEPPRDAQTAADRASSETALRAAMSMRGYRGAAGWAPERLGVSLPVRLVATFAPLLVEADGSLSVLVPVLGDRAVSADTLVDLGVALGADVAEALRVGVRVGGVGAATGSLVPGFTLSIEPWLAWRVGPVELTARGVVNVTGEDGVGASRGPAFGVFLGGGGGF